MLLDFALSDRRHVGTYGAPHGAHTSPSLACVGLGSVVVWCSTVGHFSFFFCALMQTRVPSRVSFSFSTGRRACTGIHVRVFFCMRLRACRSRCVCASALVDIVLPTSADPAAVCMSARLRFSVIFLGEEGRRHSGVLPLILVVAVLLVCRHSSLFLARSYAPLGAVVSPRLRRCERLRAPLPRVCDAPHTLSLSFSDFFPSMICCFSLFPCVRLSGVG